MHRLIVGVTGCGKSTLAKIIAWEHRRAGDNVFVCDPWQASDWHCDASIPKVDDAIEFLFQQKRGGAVIFDEAGLAEAFMRLDENNRIVAAARHYGYAIYFLAQRYIQVPPKLRDNITTIYVFRQPPIVAKEMAKQWYSPGDPILKTPNLKRFEFLKLAGWKPASWHRIEKI